MSLIATKADREPAVVGVKDTVTVQLPLAAIFWPHVFVSEKSAESFPRADCLSLVRAVELAAHPRGASESEQFARDYHIDTVCNCV